MKMYSDKIAKFVCRCERRQKERFRKELARVILGYM